MNNTQSLKSSALSFQIFQFLNVLRFQKEYFETKLELLLEKERDLPFDALRPISAELLSPSLALLEVARGGNKDVIPVAIDSSNRIMLVFEKETSSAAEVAQVIKRTFFERLKILTLSTREPSVVFNEWISAGVQNAMFELEVTCGREEVAERNLVANGGAFIPQAKDASSYLGDLHWRLKWNNQYAFELDNEISVRNFRTYDGDSAPLIEFITQDMNNFVLDLRRVLQ